MSAALAARLGAMPATTSAGKSRPAVATAGASRPVAVRNVVAAATTSESTQQDAIPRAKAISLIFEKNFHLCGRRITHIVTGWHRHRLVFLMYAMCLRSCALFAIIMAYVIRKMP